jgi:hypothetical protein
VSEYEPEFWGFKTQEEWDAWEAKQAEEDGARFYKDLMNYVRGDPHDLKPGTLGMRCAERAKELIAANPDLALPDRQAELLEAARQDDDFLVVTISDSDIAWCKTLITHEDDLPRG